MTDPAAHERMILESAGVTAPRATATALTVAAILVGVVSVLAVLGAFGQLTTGGDVLGPLSVGLGGLLGALLLHTIAVVLRWLAAYWVRSGRP